MNGRLNAEPRAGSAKAEPIKNLELVQELYFLLKGRLDLKVQWIRAHNGTRWNEYADALPRISEGEEINSNDVRHFNTSSAINSAGLNVPEALIGSTLI